MSSRLLAAVIFLLVSAGLAPTVAAGQAGPVRVAAASAPEAVRVRYRLPAPGSRFDFADKDTIRDNWTVTTPGLSLVEDSVQGEAPFDTFEILITPDAAEVDRIYVGLSAAGEGHVIYGPGLKAEGAETILTFELADGEASVPEDTPIDGYAYLGPRTAIAHDDRGEVIAGANVPTELATPMRDSFFKALAFYGDRLGSALPYHPALIASVDSPGPAQFRGDVTDTGVISARFHGDAWRGGLEQLTTFVWHEAFHLWNGHGVETPDADTAPWLHEGGAEYAALTGAVSTGALDEAGARARLTTSLNGCRRALKDAPFDPARLQSGGGPYSCGMLIQWLADLELRRAGSGDVFVLWRDMLSAAKVDNRGYDVAGFRARLVPDSAVAVLFDDPGPTRWETVKSRLADLGVTIENRPGDIDLMAAALFHVAARNCKSGSYGFYNDPGALRLDGANCGVLSGEPMIATVEGFDPQTAGARTFAAIQARCAAGETVRYLTKDGRTLEAICDAPLVEPVVWGVTSAPDISLNSTAGAGLL